jgi:ribosome-associated protein
VFLIGADELASFPTWKEPERVLELARLGVATRPGYRPEAASPRIEIFELEPYPVSSSEIRERVRQGGADRRARPCCSRQADRRARPLPRRLTLLFAATLNALTSIDQARRIAALAGEKLAEDVVILDMRPVCVYTDFFVLATGRNARQTKAIFDEVHSQLKQEARLLPRAVDGAAEAEWIIADYLDVVLHVFTPETRDFYRLEDLWGDVPAVDVEAATA